jgi:hypothetical protein
VAGTVVISILAPLVVVIAAFFVESALAAVMSMFALVISCALIAAGWLPLLCMLMLPALRPRTRHLVYPRIDNNA